MSQWGKITTIHSRGHALMGKHPRKPGNHPHRSYTVHVVAHRKPKQQKVS